MLSKKKNTIELNKFLKTKIKSRKLQQSNKKRKTWKTPNTAQAFDCNPMSIYTYLILMHDYEEKSKLHLHAYIERKLVRNVGSKKKYISEIERKEKNLFITC